VELFKLVACGAGAFVGDDLPDLGFNLEFALVAV